MPHYHAVVWLDHAEAHVMHFTSEDVEKFSAHASDRHPHLHHKRGSVGAGHQAGEPHYFDRIAALLAGVGEILVVGPGSAKLELVRHLDRHQPELGAKVLGVETVDHPTDAQVVAHARKYFIAKDRMLGHVK